MADLSPATGRGASHAGLESQALNGTGRGDCPWGERPIHFSSYTFSAGKSKGWPTGHPGRAGTKALDFSRPKTVDKAKKSAVKNSLAFGCEFS